MRPGPRISLHPLPSGPPCSPLPSCPCSRSGLLPPFRGEAPSLPWCPPASRRLFVGAGLRAPRLLGRPPPPPPSRQSGEEKAFPPVENCLSCVVSDPERAGRVAGRKARRGERWESWSSQAVSYSGKGVHVAIVSALLGCTKQSHLDWTSKVFVHSSSLPAASF